MYVLHTYIQLAIATYISYIHFYLSKGQTCHDIALLFLKSDTKGLCVSSSIANNVRNDSVTIAHANIINDINHKYFPNCSSVGTLLMLGYREFSCTLQNVNELEKVEFIIIGYNASIGDRWSATVTVVIQHNCSRSEGNYTHECTIILIYVH